MRAWDRSTTEGAGVPERLLLESAGRAAAGVVAELYPTGRIVAAVGKGNNGGDALVMLRCLRAWGRDVAAVLSHTEALSEHLLHGWSVPAVGPEQAEVAFAGAAVVVDGLLGTGASGAPRGAVAEMIRAMRSSGRPILALDGPSGVDLTTGRVDGEAVAADVTLTFGAPKRGHLLPPGGSCTGRLIVLEVGFAPISSAQLTSCLITSDWAADNLPRLPWNAHKGDAGTIVVIAGRSGMSGAAILVGMGALRSGGGVVRIISPDENRISIQSNLPEALFTPRSSDQVSDVLGSADGIVIGPGMGTDDQSRKCLAVAMEASTAPMIVDADALTLISRDEGLLPDAARERVLMTPHPLELGRLLRMETEDVVADPFAASTRAAERFGCAVLLKGAPSMVARAGTATLVSVEGHSGVATGGMGDTLAGAAGAFVAAGATPMHAGALALFFCGRAAEIAGRGRGLIPRDLSDALPLALQRPTRYSCLRYPGVLLDRPPPR
ncbi:NAD(P)H-hydrate dehydratase [soil metagenome]